jgi:2-hydroxy-3-keto-5-methylthiopentenyl-1-phosphate phosphatase
MDFDGTITKLDVGDAIYKKFGDEGKVNNIISDLLQDKISSRDCWIKLCEEVPNIDKNELNDFIDSISVDTSFIKFKEYCKNENFEIYVLSDGFDYYINRILANFGITGLNVYSNHLEIVDNKMVPSFPYYDESSVSSANCKRNHIINHSSDDEFTVFIGDGNSDKDAVEYCDYIFAKADLLRYCEMERITFFPFTTFEEVIKKLDELKAKKRLKKRVQAVLKRREAYIVE